MSMQQLVLHGEAGQLRMESFGHASRARPHPGRDLGEDRIFSLVSPQFYEL